MLRTPSVVNNLWLIIECYSHNVLCVKCKTNIFTIRPLFVINFGFTKHIPIASYDVTNGYRIFASSVFARFHCQSQFIFWQITENQTENTIICSRTCFPQVAHTSGQCSVIHLEQMRCPHGLRAIFHRFDIHNGHSLWAINSSSSDWQCFSADVICSSSLATVNLCEPAGFNDVVIFNNLLFISDAVSMILSVVFSVSARCWANNSSIVFVSLWCSSSRRSNRAWFDLMWRADDFSIFLSGSPIIVRNWVVRIQLWMIGQ